MLAQTSVLNVNDGRLLIPSFAQGQVTSMVLRTPAPVAETTISAGQRWPDTLAGVRILFSTEEDSGPGIAARIGSVRTLPYPTPGVAGNFTFIDFQVPFSLAVSYRSQFPAHWRMKTFVGTDEVDSRPVMIFHDRIRLEQRCGRYSFQDPIFGGLDDCGTRLYLEDETELAPWRILRPGEKVHAFATGLGQTDPPTENGAPFDASASVRDFRVWLEYRVNAMPRFAFADEVTRIELAKVSIVPGSVGRYRIDFEVPPTPEGAVVSSCGGMVTSNARSRFAAKIRWAAPVYAFSRTLRIHLPAVFLDLMIGATAAPEA